MFQKAVEEVSKVYPSTMQPAMEYKEWLTERMRFALAKLGVTQSSQLAGLLASILDGMTIQAQMDKSLVKIDEYWKRVYKLIQLELMEV